MSDVPPRVTMPWALHGWVSGTPTAPVAAEGALLRRVRAKTLPTENADALVAAAVALDVLASWTCKLAAEPTVLASLVERAVQLAELGFGEDPDRLNQLLAHAASVTGNARARLSRGLTECLERAAGPAAAHCSPASMALTLRRVERLAELLVEEARLALEARTVRTYHRG